MIAESKSDKPRLLILGPLPPPVGGVETVTKAVLESSALNSFEISHCDTTKGRPKQTQGKFDLGNIQWALIHFSRMWKSCWKVRPAVVYMPVTATWSGFWRDAVLAAIARLHGARLIGHVHGAWFDRVLVRGGITERLVRACLSLFNALLMLGTPWKQMVENYGYRGLVYVVPSTLQGELFKAGVKFNRNYEKKEPLGLFVGQVGERKGVFELLEALKKLKDKGTSAHIVLVGPPEGEGDWESLMLRRRELAVEDVADFVGAMQGGGLHKLYREADYFVLPSHSEGLPVVFFEAGAFGLPVIGTPVGAVTDLLENDVNALLVQPGNVAELAAAIERLRNSMKDRERLGLALRKDIAKYHPDVVCAKIASAAQDVLTNKCEQPQR